jgi:hypothetical protein
MSIIKDLFSGGIEGIVNSVGNTVDKFVTTDEEKKEAELALRKLDLELQQMQMDLEEAYIKDRDSARQMYEKDSSLQKVFAIVFLAGYLAISAIMLWLVLSWIPGAEVDIEMPQWAVVLITSVFTAMSTKVNTIVDFLFGGSQGERDSRQIQSRFESAARGQHEDGR